MATFDINEEIHRREQLFTTKLTATGNAELAVEYRGIITLRDALVILTDNGTAMSLVAATKQISTDFVGATVVPSNNGQQRRVFAGTPGFVLRTAILESAIADFPNVRFSTRQMFERLAGRYTQDITEERRSSVSASLSNLAAAGELHKTIGEDGKVYFELIT